MSVWIVLFVTSLALIGPFYFVYKPPSLLVRYLQHRWPEVLFQVSTTKRIVALTIDDSPSQYTQEILDVLTEFGATATFFVIGSQAKAEQGMQILAQIVSQGSELGNHAMADQPSRSLPVDILSTQIQEVDTIIKEIYEMQSKDRPAKYFRPGSGFFSQRMIGLVAKLQYRLVLGAIYPHDPQISFWRVNARHILSMVRPGGIIICHDRRSWTVPMLRRVLPELSRRGFEVVSVSQLLAADQQ